MSCSEETFVRGKLTKPEIYLRGDKETPLPTLEIGFPGPINILVKRHRHLFPPEIQHYELIHLQRTLSESFLPSCFQVPGKREREWERGSNKLDLWLCKRLENSLSLSPSLATSVTLTWYHIFFHRICGKEGGPFFDDSPENNSSSIGYGGETPIVCCQWLISFQRTRQWEYWLVSPLIMKTLGQELKRCALQLYGGKGVH